MWQPEIYDLKKEYGDLARSYSDSMIKIQTYEYGLDHELSKSNPGIFNDVANSDLVLTKTCQCGGHLHQGTSVSREPEIFRVKNLFVILVASTSTQPISRCDQCGLTFRSFSGLYHHQKTHEGKTLFTQK